MMKIPVKRRSIADHHHISLLPRELCDPPQFIRCDHFYKLNRLRLIVFHDFLAPLLEHTIWSFRSDRWAFARDNLVLDALIHHTDYSLSNELDFVLIAQVVIK